MQYANLRSSNNPQQEWVSELSHAEPYIAIKQEQGMKMPEPVKAVVAQAKYQPEQEAFIYSLWEEGQ